MNTPSLYGCDVSLINVGSLKEGHVDGGLCGSSVLMPERRLVTRNDVEIYLSLTSEKVQSLVDTMQITSIRVRGEERFDVRELDRLVETYKATAQRRVK